MADCIIICGSDAPVGRALVEAYGAAQVVAFDTLNAPLLLDAALQLRGEFANATFWVQAVQAIQDAGVVPDGLVYAYVPFDLSLGSQGLGAAHVLEAGLRGALLACTALLPLLAPNSAAVLLAATLGEYDTRVDAPGLGASSAGMLALARSLAVAAAPRGVRVNTVCHPVPLHSDAAALRRIPLGRATTPDDVASTVQFFLSDDARYLTGSTLLVDGGQSLQSWSNAP